MEKFVIGISSKSAIISWLATDRDSGNPYWTTYFPGAIQYDSLAAAQKHLNSGDFTRNQVMHDGTIYPPILIHSGLQLNKHNVEASGVIEIFQIKLEPVERKEISSKLIIGVDETIVRRNALSKLTPKERTVLGL